MIYGIGIDIADINRIKGVLERVPRLPERILTPKERSVYNAYHGQRQLEYLAGRFASKEAYSKALGVGIGAELSFQDIEILHDEKGKPYFSKGVFREGHSHVTLSHTDDIVTAFVVLEK
jgi:holo-[acyl-carrier protein] synthase